MSAYRWVTVCAPCRARWKASRHETRAPGTTGGPMPQLRGLLLAVDLATRRRDEAMAGLLRVQRGHLGAQDQLGQLVSYAAETESKWAVGSRASIQPEIVQHYDQFMGRLEQAALLQQAVVDDHGRAAAAARQVLLEAEIRVAGLKRLLEKRRSSLARVQAGREQKHMDELSALQFRRLHAGTEPLESP